MELNTNSIAQKKIVVIDCVSYCILPVPELPFHAVGSKQALCQRAYYMRKNSQELRISLAKNLTPG